MAPHLSSRLSFVGFILLGNLVAGCAQHQPPATDYYTPAENTPRNTTTPKQRAPVNGPRRYVLNRALDQLGQPYQYGGNRPGGFDCSGLVYYSHGQAGIAVPRTARQQAASAQPVSASNLLPGDLLFFRLNGRKTSHVGIYAGNGEFVHAPSSGKKVSIARLDNPYWRKHLVSSGTFF